MKCLVLHNRRTYGPKESSWWTFHYISKELKKRGHLLGEFSVDHNFTDDNGNHITDEIWNNADFIFTVFRDAYGPLMIAKLRSIPSFLEINYACGEIVTTFMDNEVKRLGFDDDELAYETKGLGRNMYDIPSYVVGAGNTEYTEKTYHQYGLNRVKMFNAGIDHHHFLPNYNLRGKGKIRFTFTAAVFAFRKGIVHLSRAWRAVPKEYKDKIELHMFGREPFAKNTMIEYKKMREECDNVFYHGFISNQDKNYIREHSISDVMICPTMAEGQSATALEGLSFGLYPIISPYSGVLLDNTPSKILSENPEKWVDEIVKSIIECVDNYDTIKNHSEEIRNAVIKNHSWDNFSNNFVDFMEQVYTDHTTIKKWTTINGDATLRLQYNLDKDSVVVDGGSFQGEWGESINKLYNSRIFLFEPVPMFYEEIKKKFINNSKMIVINAAISTSDDEGTIFVSPNEHSWNGSTMYNIDGWNKIIIKKIDFINWMNVNKINSIDLLKLNIEGSEYEILEQLVLTGKIKDIKNIQVQFHRNVDNAEKRRLNIQKRLKETHIQTYNYDFVWENWSIK